MIDREFDMECADAMLATMQACMAVVGIIGATIAEYERQNATMEASESYSRYIRSLIDKEGK